MKLPWNGAERLKTKLQKQTRQEKWFADNQEKEPVKINPRNDGSPREEPGYDFCSTKSTVISKISQPTSKSIDDSYSPKHTHPASIHPNIIIQKTTTTIMHERGGGSQNRHWLFEALNTFHKNHEKLKHSVHEKFRYPLPPWGRFLMGCFYFSVPVVGGWYVMQWAISKSHDSIGRYGEKLLAVPVDNNDDEHGAKIMGQTAIVDGQEVQVGAGGWGGGVRMVTSDEETQRRNREMLHKFLRKQKRKMENERQQKLQMQEEKGIEDAQEKEEKG
jgi:hypothetical protein